MFVLAMLAVIALFASSRTSSTPLLDAQTMSAARELASVKQPAAIPLATAGGIQLMLPIYQQQVTAIGYDTADDANAINMTPNGRQANGSLLEDLGGGGGNNPVYYVMGDGGNGSATSAMDVGAPAGTPVFSPVDGVIVGIRSYDLNGACPDTEVKIQPQSQPDVVVVMTHLTSIEATLGQPLKAGESRIGAVRALDSCVVQKLSQYTYDSGNHLHMRVEATYNAGLGS